MCVHACVSVCGGGGGVGWGIESVSACVLCCEMLLRLTENKSIRGSVGYEYTNLCQCVYVCGVCVCA